jgi:hypothetical protein
MHAGRAKSGPEWNSATREIGLCNNFRGFIQEEASEAQRTGEIHRISDETQMMRPLMQALEDLGSDRLL